MNLKKKAEKHISYEHDRKEEDKMAEPKNDILQQLVNIASDQKPFAVMGLDTIGKDDSREIFHVVIQNFAYNDAANQYEMGSRLELMQKCSQDIPQGDLKRFGIIDTYANGALDSMEFANKLTAFVIEELDDSLLIVNGNDFVVNSLTKVKGCESLYADKAEQGLAMNSSNLIGAYMQEHDASGDTPRAYLKYIKAEKANAVTCDEKIAAVSSLIRQCCEEYSVSAEKTAPVTEISAGQENLFESELSELASATENTFDDFLNEFHAEQQSAKEEPPVAEIPPKQRVYHIETDLTPEQQAILDGMQKQDIERDEAISEAWSEKGKKEYREGTVKQKLEILKRAGIVAEDLTALHEMYQMLDRESGDNGRNNGFTVLQAGTTGLQAGNRVTQIAFATYDIDETGKAGLTKIAGFSRLVCADMEYIQKAEQIAQSGNFDAFAHGGIDLEKYKALCEAGVSNKAENFCTISTLSNTIAKYFEAYPVSQYPIVSAGMANKKMDIPEELKGKVSYSQGALLQSINNESLATEPIDFTQVIKEYMMAVQSSEEYKGENVLFPDKTPPDNLKRFGLDAIAEQNGKDITGVAARCVFMAEMIAKIQEQHLTIEQIKNQKIEMIEQARARIKAIEERYSKAVQRKEKSGFQEESFQKPENPQENQELFHTPDYSEDSLQSPAQPQDNALNQKIAGLSEMAQKFTEEMSKPASAEHIERPSPVSAEHTDRLYDSLNKVSTAMTENNAVVQGLAQGLTVQNENNSQTNANMGQLIVTLNTMVTTLQENMQTQKEESRAVISALEKQIQVQEEQIKTQKKENAQLLDTVKRLAEIAAETQGQFINVNERIAETQEQNVSMIENQNTYAKATSTLVKEVAAVKADGADTRDSLASFRQETRESFDRTNQTITQHSAVLERHEAEIGNVKAATRENRAEIRKVRTEFSEKINLIARNSAAMAKIAKEQSGQLETLCANQNELASGFVELNDRMAETGTRIMDLEQLYKGYTKEDMDLDMDYHAYPSGDYPRTEYSGRY